MKFRSNENESLGMMKDPMRWPNLVLPLKRHVAGKNWPEFALLFASIENPVKYKVALNVSLFDEESSKNATWVETTPEKLVADGWEVD